MPSYVEACDAYPGITLEFYTSCVEALSCITLKTSKIHHGKAGRGVFADRDIAKGEIICLVFGKIMNRAECNALWALRFDMGEDDHRYLMNVSSAKGKFAFNLKGWAAGFFNQCRKKPSAFWTMLGSAGVICAKRDISFGEEITIKYWS